METSPKLKTPKTAITLSIIFLITNMLTMFFNQLNDSIFVFPSHLYEPLQWYRVFTYPFYGGGLLNWIIFTFMIVGSGCIIENKLTTKQIWIIIVSATVAAGFAYMILHQADDFDPPMASPTFIAWAFTGAALVSGIYTWKNSGWFQKIWVVIVSLLFISLVTGNNKLKTETILVSLCVVVLTFILVMKNRNHEN